MEKVKFGIIGVGNMGSGHLSSFMKGKVENGICTAIADLDGKKLAAAKENNPGTYACYASGEELIENADVDAVIIAVPHYFHPPLAIAALKKGLHVVCEKPAGVYTKQVREMNAVAEKSGKLFTLMYNQRTNPLYKKMHALVKEGEIGEIRRVNWIITNWFRTQFYYDSGSWRATWRGEGGGVLMNQCPHQLDLWQWIFGMPTRIHAFCHEGKFHDIEVEDDVTAYAEYANGATGVFITTTGETPGTNRLEITGTMGKMVAEGTTLTFWKNEVDGAEWCRDCSGGFDKPKCEKIEYHFDNAGPQHQGILQNFTDHLVNGAPLLASGYEGINGLSICNAMMLSSWKNDFVDLPINGDEFWTELKKRIDGCRGREKKHVEEKIADLSDTYTSK